MNYFTWLKTWFESMSSSRRRIIAGSFFLLFFFTGLGIYWTLSPTYGVLFNHLDIQDANQIIAKLEAAHTPYQVRNQGSEILIDKETIDKTRIQILGSDMQLTGTVGFELFDRNDFGMTDFSQKINYQRALQGELERTINSLEEIKKVRIHLVIPEHHLFEEQENVPHAAVTVHLKKALAPQQVKSIQQLIAASVPQLAAHHVVIVDQNGHHLMAQEDDTAQGRLSEKRKMEHYLNQKAMLLLGSVFTHQNVMVKIDVTLNYDELRRELEKPQPSGIIVHEKESQHANTIKTGKMQGNSDFTREKSYQLGQEKELFTRANGTIERLTVSVVLPKDTTASQIEQVERLVKSVIGFQAARGDTISVEALLPVSRSLPLSAPSSPALPAPTIPIPWLKIIIGLSAGALPGLYLYLQTRLRRREILLKALRQWLITHQ